MKKELHPTLHSALHLDGSPATIKKFYADWADKYNSDTANWQYVAPNIALYLMQNLSDNLGLSIDPQDKNLKIMDAGCGTGLLGQVLSEAEYINISGFDISDDMVEIADRTKIYRNLVGNVDINAPIRDAWVGQFDCTFSIGVFTPGHVPPQALSQLVQLTRPGGLIILSTRVAYFVEENFRAFSEALEAKGEIQLVCSLKNKNYTHDGKAHYFAYTRRLK